MLAYLLSYSYTYFCPMDKLTENGEEELYEFCTAQG